MMEAHRNTYIIIRDGASGVIYSHPTKALVEKEAKRLAEKEPGSAVVIFQPIGYYRAPVPTAVKHEPDLDL